MDYIIAQYRIRTVGPKSDLAECGLRGFKPFLVEEDLSQTPTMELHTDTPLTLDEFGELTNLYEFTFEASYSICRFARYADGYIFSMSKDDYNMIFVSKNGSNIIKSNYALLPETDVTLLRFGLWKSFGIIIAPLGAIAIHSSVVVKDDMAVLCLGESGTGKSTHTRLWRENIEGAHLLNDDSPIIRMVDGVPTVFGSAWSGKTPCFRNLSYPIKGFIRLSQAPYNAIKQLPVLNAIGALLPSCPPAFAYDNTLQDAVCDTLSEMISTAPVYHLECLPDSAAAELSYSTLFKK